MLWERLAQYIDVSHFRVAVGLGQHLAGAHEVFGVLCPPSNIQTC